jgi:surfeit locus 1 family protein
MSSKTLVVGKLQIKFNWLIAACVLAAVSGLLRLGIWQLDRTQEKLEIQENYEQMGQSEAALIPDVSLGGLQTDVIALQNKLVSLEGEYLNQQAIYMVYQTYEGQIGYEIVTPFLLSSEDKIIMVSRGWMLANSYEELNEKVPQLTGKQNIQGQIYVPSESMASKTNALTEVKFPLEIRYLNTLELAPFFEASVFPYVVRLNEGQVGVLVRHWPNVIVDTNRNMSYALQWFAMAIALLIVSLILSSNLLELIKQSYPESDL